ncbi:MAG: glycosyltransferase [Deltaproteobacteria bacterium]|nr:MAG: glycosyltransferase [Deltaproteobacteria bacterium]
MNDVNLSIVIPVYNSEKTIAALVNKVNDELAPMVKQVEFVLVNDGSQDNSHDVIVELSRQYATSMRYIQLFRNFGEHNAVMCALNNMTGDCAVIIDDDFQNPPKEIIKLVKTLYEDQVDVVYSYYEQKKHSLFRNWGSRFNGFVAQVILKKPKGLYLSSFKALSKELIDIIIQYQGPYPYVDALVLRSTQSIGRSLCQHNERETGRSNYNLRRLIRLWLNMFIGFSVWPLRLMAIAGVSLSLLAFLMVIYFILARLMGPFIFMQDIPPGWASTISLITLFFGLHFLSMAILGEYIGRLVLTINKEPQYLIRKKYPLKSKKNDGSNI